MSDFIVACALLIIGAVVGASATESLRHHQWQQEMAQRGCGSYNTMTGEWGWLPAYKRKQDEVK